MQSVRESTQKQMSSSDFSAVKLPEGMKFLKIEKGDMLIDIIPYKVGKNNPYADEGNYYYERTYYLHRKVGPAGGAHICLARSLNSKCPVCEYIEHLRGQGELDKDSERQMRPKRRQLMHVVNCKDREAGVQLLELSYSLFGELLANRVNSDAGRQNGWDEFADPEKGFRLGLTIKEKALPTNKYLEVVAIDFLDRKKQYGWEFVDEQTYCLDKLLKIESYDDLKEIVSGGGEDDGPAADPEERRPARRAEADPEDRAPARRADPEERPAARRRDPEDDGKSPNGAPARRPAADEDWDKEPARPARRAEADPEDRAPARRARDVEEVDPEERPARRADPEDAAAPRRPASRFRDDVDPPARAATRKAPADDWDAPAERPARRAEADPEARPARRAAAPAAGKPKDDWD